MSDSLILSFDDAKSRQQFVERMARDCTGSVRKSHMSRNLFHVTFKDLLPEEMQWIRDNAAPGKVHENIQFQLLEHQKSPTT